MQKKKQKSEYWKVLILLISTPEPAMPHAVAFVCNLFRSDMLQKMIINSEVFKGYFIYFVDNINIIFKYFFIF